MATIVVVDDESTNRDFLVTLLGYLDHRLLEAEDGAEALKVVQAERPELVIIDLDMPTMDGYEFVRQLRADPAIAHTRVMFCTATEQQSEAWALAQSYGVQHVITKPAEPAVVLRSVTQALALPPSTAQPLSAQEGDRERLQVLTDKLLKQVQVLEREAAERTRGEQEREALYQLTHDLACTSEIRAVGEHLFAQAKRLLSAEYGELLLVDAAGTALRGVAAYGLGPQDFAQERIDLSELAVVSLAVQQKEIVVVPDYPQSPLVSERLRKKYHYIRELWAVPLASGTQMRGVFSVGYLTPQTASAEQLRLLRLLGEEAALALERIRLAEELQEREARLHCLFEASIIGIFFADLTSGAIIDANDAFLQMLGYQRQDLVAGQLRWEEMTPPAYRPLDERKLNELKSFGVCPPYEKAYLDRAGRQISVVVGAALLEGGAQTCVVFALNISGRKQMERLLQRERDFTAAVLETAGALVVVLDRQGCIVRFNRACEQTTGYSFAEMRGRWIGELWLPEKRDSVWARFTELLLSIDRVGSQREDHWLARDGSRHLIAWANTPLFDAAGAVEYVISTGIDITEQRKTEQRRSAQLAITRILASASSLPEAAPRFLQICCEQLGWDLGELWTLEPDSEALQCESSWAAPFLEAAEFVATSRQSTFLPGQGLADRVWADGKPVWIFDVAVDTTFPRLRSVAQGGLRTAIAFPVRSNEHVIAVIEFFSREIQSYDPDLLVTLTDIGSQIGHFIERRRAEDSLRQLSGQLLRLQDEERRRLARELHDSTAQNLTAAAVNLAIVDTSAAALEPQARHFLAESIKLVQESINEIRTFSYLLHPPLLEELGLVSALAWFGERFTHRSGVQVHLEAPPELGRLPQEVELALFRIVQEGLTNIHRHSTSTTARIQLARDARHIVLTVTDQGRGMSAGLQQRMTTADPLLGVGLAGMRERVRQLGGQLDIHSGNQGTTLTVTLPVAGDGG